MRCLVTGGAGFIGSNLVHLLLRRGHKVTILDNCSTGYAENLELYPEARFIRGDIRDEVVVDSATSGQDVVFHLAASVGNKKSIEEPRFDAAHNVLGTINVLEAIRRYEVGTLVYSSSAGIFGEPQYQPVDEKHPCAPTSPYGSTKLCGENLALSYMRLYNIRVSSLRYFNVYGKNQRFDAYGNVISIFTAQILRGESMTIFGDGDQTRDFIDVQDVVAANVAAAENPQASGLFNVGAGSATSVNHVADLLGRLTDTDLGALYKSPRPGDVRHCTADTTRLREVLGVYPKVELEKRLKEYYLWTASDKISKDKVFSASGA